MKLPARRRPVLLVLGLGLPMAMWSLASAHRRADSAPAYSLADAREAGPFQPLHSSSPARGSSDRVASDTIDTGSQRTTAQFRTETVSGRGQARNTPPVAHAGGPYRWPAGEAIQFDGTASSDAEGALAAYSWNFGDGAGGSGALVSHAYLEPGRYTATLTVTDAAGATASETTAVTIEPQSTTSSVVWTAVANATASGNDLFKPTNGNAAWDAGATSQQTLLATGGYVDFTISDQGALFVAGLGFGDAGTAPEDVEFGLRFEGLTVQAAESGVASGPQFIAEPGDRFRVSLESGIARYAKNGRLLRESGSLRRIGVAALDTEPDVDWELLAATDVDGDGNIDLVWHHATLGEVQAWLMNGPVHTSTLTLGTEPDTNWVLSGAGDIDSSGAGDLLWHNRVTGAVRAWLLAPGSTAEVVDIGVEKDHAWIAQSVGDLDGDGLADLLWRNVQTGALRAWLLHGANQVGTLSLPVEPDLARRIVGLGEVNQDAAPDILWTNGQNKSHAWYMQAGSLLAPTGQLPLPTHPDWVAAVVGDINADGRADLVWRNMSSGAIEVWYLDGTSPPSVGADTALWSPGAAVVDARMSSVPNIPPTANAGGTYLWTAGNPIEFDGTGSEDPDGSIATYAWNFGDGGTGTGVKASHSYATAGPYVATLTVTDTHGASASATATVQVQPAFPGQAAVWADPVGVQVVGSSLVKTNGEGWNAGAAGHHWLMSGDGYVEFLGGLAGHRMAGLGTGNASPHFGDIEFALHLVSDGTMRTFESGVLQGVVGHYQQDDHLRVVVHGGAVYYVKNGRVLATTGTPPTYPLLLDTSLYSVNAYLSGGRTAGEHLVLHNGAPTVTVTTADCHAPCTAPFTASASDPDGDPLTYSWTGCAAGQTGPTATCPIATVTAVTATVTATDSLGATASASATAHGFNSAPTVSLSGPTSGHPSCTLNFTASASDPNGDPVTFAWGDCATGQSGPSASCSFTSTGGGTPLPDAPVLSWVPTTFSVLNGYLSGCNGPADVGSASCRAATDRFCRAQPGHAGGFGPVEYDAVSAWVRCVGTGFGQQEWTTWSALALQQEGCSGPAAATTPACAAASHRYCTAHGLGSGFGPVESGATDVMVFCTGNAVTHLAQPPLSQLAACSGGASASGACLTAANRKCADLGYGGGFGAVGVGPTTATVSCLPSSQIRIAATVSVVGNDGHGGTGSAASTITLTNTRPDVSVSVAGDGCHAPCTATFTATAADADGDPLTYAWIGCAQGQSGPTATCLISSAGSVQATVLAQDSLGATASVSATASGSNAAPTVSITGDESCHPPCIANLSAAASDPDNDPLTLTWGGCAVGQTGPSATCAIPALPADGQPANPKPVARLLTVPFSVLNGYVVGDAPVEDNCTSTYWDGGKCRMGANRYCKDQDQNNGMFVGGLAPVEPPTETHPDAQIVCFGKDLSARIVTSWATLQQHYDACPVGGFRYPACRVATDWFCQSLGFGTGAGPLDDGPGPGEVEVVCTAKAVTRPKTATFVELTSYIEDVQGHDSCANDNSSSGGCRVAVNRLCRQQGYGGGIGTAAAGLGVAQLYCLPAETGVAYSHASVVADDGGGGSASASRSILVTNGWPAALSLVATPQPCVAPCDLHFTASAVDPDGDPLAVSWGGCAIGKTGDSVICSALPPGVVTASVSISDGLGGSVQDSAQAIVDPAPQNVPPVSKPGGPYRAVVGRPLSLDGRGSYDSDGMIAQAIWSFGDGTNASGLLAVHTYASPGTYSAWLGVWDDQNASHAAQAQVTVVAEDDPDGDGLTNAQEQALGSNPNNADTNGDGVPDGAALALGLSLTDMDMDHDGLPNPTELRMGTDPFRVDTDGDGHGDAQDAFPLDPTRWDATPPPGDGDPPVINLQRPEGAVNASPGTEHRP